MGNLDLSDSILYKIKKMTIRCFAFDFDNTLVNSIEASLARHIAFAKEFDIPIAKVSILKRAITSGEKSENIFNRCHPGAHNHYNKYCIWRKETLLQFKVTAFIETMPLMNALESKDILVAILSQRCGGLIETLDSIGLDSQRFFLLQDETSGRPPKPDPGFFQKLIADCDALNIKLSEILYVDDTLLGWVASKAARINFLGVTTGSTTKYSFKKAGAQSLDSLDEITRVLLN